MRRKLLLTLLISIPFLICSCSDTGEAEKPVNPETSPVKTEDGTEVEIDTI